MGLNVRFGKCASLSYCIFAQSNKNKNKKETVNKMTFYKPLYLLAVYERTYLILGLKIECILEMSLILRRLFFFFWPPHQ